MTEQRLRRPARRRLADTLLTALAPVAACGLALAGLSTWAAHGNAGSPARIAVGDARVLLPYGGLRDTAAFFRVTNSGGADDRLLKVTSSVGGTALSRHRMADGGGTGYRQTVDAAVVPAGGSLAMSPDTLDVTVRAEAEWRAGDLVPFTLHFERSGQVRTLAVVVRPGGNGP